MKKKLLSILFSAAALLIMAGAPVEAANKYIIEVPVPKGVSVGSLSNMLKEISKVLSKKIGDEFVVSEVQYQKGSDEQAFMTIMKDLKSGKATMGLVASSAQYAKHKSEIESVAIPFLTLTLNNTAKGDACTYVLKSSSAKSIVDTKGKAWGGTLSTVTRYVLYTKGINVPMKEFFGKIMYIDDSALTAPFQALLDKKIDVYISPSYIYQMVTGGNKKFVTDIKNIGCTEFEHSWFFVYKKTAPADVMNKLKNIMINSNKDKDFAQFKFMFAAIKGQFVAFDPKDLAVSEKIGALFKKYNWEKEQADFIKNKK